MITNPHKIGPLFKWFGSKWQSAKRYPEPMHETIVELFAGSAGYSLNYCDRNVVLWENDPNLKALWKWLINSATDRDILEIPLNVPIGTDIRTIGLNKGQELLLKHWQRTNNVGDCWTISPWGNLPGQWTENTRSRVSSEVYAVRHWKFLNPASRTDWPSTWFIDPPYLYNYRYRKSSSGFNFDSLASFVQTIHSRSLIIVCEAVCKKTGRIPDYLPFSRSHKSVTSRRKAGQSHHSDEIVYVKYPQ